jgi:hypothetical protein
LPLLSKDMTLVYYSTSGLFKVASELQRDSSVLGRPKKGAMVDPVELQWTSAGTGGFVQAARAIPGKADAECCDGQAMLALGQSETTSRRGSGCYGK